MILRWARSTCCNELDDVGGRAMTLGLFFLLSKRACMPSSCRHFGPRLVQVALISNTVRSHRSICILHFSCLRNNQYMTKTSVSSLKTRITSFPQLATGIDQNVCSYWACMRSAGATQRLILLAKERHLHWKLCLRVTITVWLMCWVKLVLLQRIWSRQPDPTSLLYMGNCQEHHCRRLVSNSLPVRKKS